MTARSECVQDPATSHHLCAGQSLDGTSSPSIALLYTHILILSRAARVNLETRSCRSFAQNPLVATLVTLIHIYEEAQLCNTSLFNILQNLQRIKHLHPLGSIPGWISNKNVYKKQV